VGRRADGIAGVNAAKQGKVGSGYKFFGYINDDKQFVLGLIPILGFISLRPKTYNDHLDDILSEDDLHNLTQDEVVSMACDRGMKGCNSALLRQRVKNWDKE